MVLLSVPDKLIVMTYLCQIRAFCTGQELQLVQLKGGDGSGTYRVGSATPSLPDGLDAGNLAQRLRERGAEAPKQPKEAASRAEDSITEAAGSDAGCAPKDSDYADKAVRKASPPGVPAADVPAAPVPPAEGLVNGAGETAGTGGVRLRQPSVSGEAGPVPPPRAHGSFSHVRDADLLKKRRSRLRNSNSFSVDEPDAGAAGSTATAVVSTPYSCRAGWWGAWQSVPKDGAGSLRAGGHSWTQRGTFGSAGPRYCGQKAWHRWSSQQPPGGPRKTGSLLPAWDLLEVFLLPQPPEY